MFTVAAGASVPWDTWGLMQPGIPPTHTRSILKEGGLLVGGSQRDVHPKMIGLSFFGILVLKVRRVKQTKVSHNLGRIDFYKDLVVPA